VYCKTRKRSVKSVRAAAAVVVARHDKVSLVDDEEDDGMDGAPEILGEEARLAYRGRTLECVWHDSDGCVVKTLIYDLDGYGRVKSVR
jgi:hypothetical protein